MVQNLAIIQIYDAGDSPDSLIFKELGHCGVLKIRDPIIKVNPVKKARIFKSI